MYELMRAMFDCLAPSWLSPGWYRLCVASWLLIVVGWYACAMAAVKSLITSMVLEAQDKVEQMADDAINPQQVITFLQLIGLTLSNHIALAWRITIGQSADHVITMAVACVRSIDQKAVPNSPR
jgi:hypothetical protein